MTFNEYSKRAHATAVYNPQYAAFYPVLGLCGEVGEVAEKVKKIFRDGGYNKFDLTKELGDVLWYLNEICIYHNTSLEIVAQLNIQKLESRKERGMLHGSGDNR